MTCEQIRELLSPFSDDELDAASSRAVERHVAGCAACAAALDELRALGIRVRREADYEPAPDTLRARVLADIGLARPGASGPRAETIAPGRARIARANPWRGLAIAAGLLVLLGGAWYGGRIGAGEDALMREVTAAHVRSLQPGHLMDVVSTDQHTVKPWFAGRLDYSPPVTDLAPDFPLIGGRLDVLNGRPVAALVYQRRKHVINVFAWPEPGARDAVGPTTSRDGWHVIEAAHAGMALRVVSDLDPRELEGFAQRLIAAK
ncbi:MAG TPA: zf-HC2 domain-containing protein [Candidatus Eisenbacteria bacterium]|nr:zf-HC2 domain-containing protein [Candidatus Eisenbacteria bacterium]